MAGEHMQEDFLKINPQHTVPTIVDDGYVLWESKAIATYLVEQHKPDSTLYPADPKKRGIINQRLYFDSTVLFARSFAAVQPVMRQGATIIPQEKKDAVKDALGTLNGYLDGQDWVAGENTTVADLCLLATVSSLEVRSSMTICIRSMAYVIFFNILTETRRRHERSAEHNCLVGSLQIPAGIRGERTRCHHVWSRSQL